MVQYKGIPVLTRLKPRFHRRLFGAAVIADGEAESPDKQSWH
jgi:hypothetical protein